MTRFLLTFVVLLAAVFVMPFSSPLTPLMTAQASSLHIRVDQFGYLPQAEKVAVLREPVVGYDAPGPYTPGNQIEIRRTSDNTVAFSGPSSAWENGDVHTQSGDRVWWFDFTSLQENGSFYVHDPANGISSENFEIAPNAYADVLVQAVRFYYYRRCGAPREVPYAHSNWTDTACHLGAEQDLDCRDVLNPSLSTSRDLSGGWHDAGDYNKYVNYTDGALHDLLAAFEAHPLGWGDDYGIPESGNGVPDLLDEIKWELDWLLKMQIEDGSVLHKMAVTDWSEGSPPSTHATPRRYAPPTASATISACGAFARAALVFESLDDLSMQAYASELEVAAVSAWSWLEANPGQIPSSYDNAGFVNASAEDDAYWQEMNRLRAAVFLFALTGDSAYRSFFDGGYMNSHLFLWWWASPWEQELQDAWLFYAALPAATASVVADIRTRYESLIQGADHLGQVMSGTDAYRAYLSDGDHTWGSNRTKSLQGVMYAAMNRYGIDPQNAAEYRNAAAGYLHYVHGVNPTGYSFLTNMSDFGADESVTESYHGWFRDGTVWDSSTLSLYGPGPGILTGGVNPSYQPDTTYSGPPIVPPENQPILKSYLDWNTGWPENSWEISECHIPYQAAYIRLLAEFAAHPPAILSEARFQVPHFFPF